MKHIVRPFIIALAVLCGCVSSVLAQNSKFIDININSGNPAFPFPQFLEYKEGKSLAKYNAEGVTHADMEKTMREAYEIMSHRARYNGQEVGGVKYISFNPASAKGSNESEAPKCSEGDGYFMLAAAIYADQPTFNGVWMLVHDSKIPKVKKYSDGKILFQDYPYSPGMACCYTSDEKIEGETMGPHGVYPNEGSAMDGDDDIALALLIAYKQWGDTMKMNGKPVIANGEPILYKQMAKDYISAFVDTFLYTADGFGHGSGNIGIDGYIHGGNKGGDMTQWRLTQTDYPGISESAMGSADAWFDYAAPAYFNEFAKWLEEDNVENPDPKNAWRIQQYKRGEASCDWLIGEAYKQGLIPSIAKFAFNNGNDIDLTFTNDGKAEDFRLAWRTILNYVWHGNPETTWNPKTHQVEAGGNTFERDMALRFAEFLKNAPGQGESPTSNPNSGGQSSGRCITAGASPDPGQPYWSGVCNIIQQYDKNGGVAQGYPTNFTVGCGAPSAVASGDLEFLGDMYRESELRWDGNDCGISSSSPKRYKESTPLYFHGWFRNLGLLVNSGNFHAPSNMVPAPNMKVYMSVDKTYAYVDDQIEYTVQFRNYGSKDATGVVIETALDPNYEVVAITRGNGTITQGQNIKWNIGTVPGFKTGKLDATIDSVSFIVVAKDTLNPRICLTSTISTTDENNKFEPWTSNEYPNHATATMERNCVDILPSRTLQLKKTASRNVLNPNNIVKFTIEFENKSLGEASWLNGGRDNVRLSYANYLSGDNAYTFIQGYRLWHSASEAYINTGNYRCSYFMYDAAAIGVYDPVENPTGWGVYDDGQAADLKKYGLNNGDDTIKFTYQRVPYYEDPENGKRCNQRLITQFPSTLMAPSSWVFQKIATDNGGGEGAGSGFCYIHKGIGGPFFIRTGLRIKAGNSDMAIGKKFYDDWSYEKLHVPTGQASTMQGSPLFLLTPCYANYDNLGYPVDKHGRDVCDIKGVSSIDHYDRILVEEFDGYTWRRILGTAPRPGREAYDVTIVDTIPYELEFFAWIDSTALKDEQENRIKATYTPAPAGCKDYSGIVKWTTPVMLVGEKDKLVYSCVARDMGCPDAEDVYYSNVAWISSRTDSPDSSRVDLRTTCSEIPPVGEAQESLFKSADKKSADQGETVEYKVKYINNTGTHVEADCKSTNGWKPLGNSSLPSVQDGHILLNTETSHMFAPEYSYGRNGDVYLSMDNCDRDAIINTWVVLRYRKGIPGQQGFEGVAVKLIPHSSTSRTFKCEAYDGNKKLSLGEFDDDEVAYRGNVSNPEFKLSIIDDKLYLYINNAEDDWEDVLRSWKGLSYTEPGWFGMYVNGKTNAAPHLTEFITDLDYAFNVTLYDQLPEELGNVTNISDNGSWDESKNFISWPTVATTVETAIPPMDSVVRTYTAEVKACVDRYITNMGIATVYGLDTLKVLNTISCGVECSLLGVDLSADDNRICEGDSVMLAAIVRDENDGNYYQYEFFLDGISLGHASSSHSIYAKKTGSYRVVASSAADPSCFAESSPFKLTVNERPSGEDFALGTLCVRSAVNDNEKYKHMVDAIGANHANGVNYSWENDNGGVPTLYPSVGTEVAGDFSRGYVLSSEYGCASDTFHLTYTVSDTAVVKLSDLTICSGQSGTLTAGTDLTYTYLWNDGSTQNELVTDQPGKYSVVVTTPEGCESKASATVTVADELKVDLGTDTTICDGNLPLVLDASNSYDTYEWTDGSTLSTLSVTQSGEYEVKVTQGSCSGSGKINVTVSPTPVLKGSFKVTYLVNDTTAAGVFDKSLTVYDANVLEKESGITYSWYDEDKNKLADEPTPAVPAGGGNTDYTYYVKAENVDGCESDFQKVVAVVSGSPMPSADDVVYCLNDPSVKALEAKATDNGSNTLWTLAWYDAAGTRLPDAPVPDVSVAGETKYFVSQIDQQGTEGGKTPVTVTVYALPQLKAEPQDVKLCNISYELGSAFQEVNGLSVSYAYFDSNKDLLPASDPKVEKSGTYYAKASYVPISGLTCETADFTAVNVLIDQITDVEVKASPSICPYGETELSASAKSLGSTLDIFWRGDASSDDPTLKVKDETGEYGKVYSYDLVIEAGVCTFDTTVMVTVGRGVLTGALSANGVDTKTYRTCGDEDIALNTTHDGQDFKWTTYDGDLLESAKSTVVHPTQTTTYVLSFVNECETSDTLVVEVYPFSVSTDFSGLDTAVCEGVSASGRLILNGYDEKMEGSYIKWYKNDVEMTGYAGVSELNFTNVSAADEAVYSFEASNGICLAKSLDGVSSAHLIVKPFVSFATPVNVVAANGASATLELLDMTPSDATVVWKGSVNEGTGNPFEIAEVFSDEMFSVNVSADGYCEQSAYLQLLVDAKVVVSATTSTPKICSGEPASLVADTVGTGHLLYPEQYSIVWYACDESGVCGSLQMKGTELTHYPEAGLSYYAVVTYGNQEVHSDTIPVTVISQVSYTTSMDVVSCSGEEVTLSVALENAPNAVVTWSDGTQSDSLTVTPTEATEYGFTITQDGICPQEGTIPVEVKEKPSITMGDDVVVCSGNGITLTPTVGGDDIDTYHWIGPDGDTIAHTRDLTIPTEPESGSYTLVAVSKLCGESSASQKVEVVPLPELLIDSLALNSRKIVAVGHAGMYEYKVDNKEWSTQDVYENLTYDYPHTAFVRDERGCENMTVFTIISPPIAIPDYFTPSDDGMNDSWDLSTIMDAYPNTKVTIYDRTGKVVAVLEGDVMDWDGTYNGNPLPSTDYWYLINVPEIRKQFTGHFTLIRSK